MTLNHMHPEHSYPEQIPNQIPPSCQQKNMTLDHMHPEHSYPPAKTHLPITLPAISRQILDTARGL
jgi:hypothetical protein